MGTKKTIFLTGASGHMGQEGLKQLLHREDVTIVALVLPTPADRAEMARYAKEPALKIIWGDLRDYAAVLEGVTGADIVLHVGGMVSPAADYHPVLTRQVNVGGIKNIIRAIKAQPEPDRVRLVYIGSVAQTGDRNPPLHWGRVGDPIYVSRFDTYGQTKVAAEREVVESGLKYWVSLRQTSIAHSGLVSMLDPILYHQPLNGVLEWVTSRDSGRLLARVCDDGLPETFWRKIYNIGGGEKCRLANHEFLQKYLSAFGVKDFRAVFEPNWFTLQNFHGQWFEDSDDLESLLHFRSEDVDDFVVQAREEAPNHYRLMGAFPPGWIKKTVMEPVVRREFGPLHWIRRKSVDKIRAYFGSLEAWESIPGWDRFALVRPSAEPVRLDHGFDESIPRETLGTRDFREAARFRGGECLAKETDAAGGLSRLLRWRCAFGHQFDASPLLVLLGGHWCPSCASAPWNYAAEARVNSFLAQVWYNNHPAD